MRPVEHLIPIPQELIKPQVALSPLRSRLQEPVIQAFQESPSSVSMLDSVLSAWSMMLPKSEHKYLGWFHNYIQRSFMHTVHFLRSPAAEATDSPFASIGKNILLKVATGNELMLAIERYFAEKNGLSEALSNGIARTPTHSGNCLVRENASSSLGKIGDAREVMNLGETVLLSDTPEGKQVAKAVGQAFYTTGADRSLPKIRTLIFVSSLSNGAGEFIESDRSCIIGTGDAEGQQPQLELADKLEIVSVAAHEVVHGAHTKKPLLSLVAEFDSYMASARLLYELAGYSGNIPLLNALGCSQREFLSMCTTITSKAKGKIDGLRDLAFKEKDPRKKLVADHNIDWWQDENDKVMRVNPDLAIQFPLS